MGVARARFGGSRAVTPGLPTDSSRALKHLHSAPAPPPPGLLLCQILPVREAGWAPGSPGLTWEDRQGSWHFQSPSWVPGSGLELSPHDDPVQQGSVPSLYK